MIQIHKRKVETPVKPTVLLYGVEETKLRTIQVLCVRFKIRVRPVKPEEYGQPLEAVLGFAAMVQAPEESDVPEEMLVMAGFSAPLMDSFLTGLRQNRVSLPLKAALTQTNQSWSGTALYRELCREREAFRQGRIAHEG